MTVDLLGGDSSIRDIQYVAGILSLTWADFDSDQDYQVQIRSDRLFYDPVGGLENLHWRLVCPADYLPIEVQSGRFVAPQKFSQQMQMAREHLYLLIGESADVGSLLFQIRHAQVVLACPVESKGSIHVQSIPGDSSG